MDRGQDGRFASPSQSIPAQHRERKHIVTNESSRPTEQTFRDGSRQVRPRGFPHCRQGGGGDGSLPVGGGYRAMLYHAGALVRLNEFGLLPCRHLREIASVSGVNYRWRPRMRVVEAAIRRRRAVRRISSSWVMPLVRFAAESIDIKAILLDCCLGSPPPARCQAYDRYLFSGATLHDLPDAPRFTFRRQICRRQRMAVRPRITPPIIASVASIDPP